MLKAQRLKEKYIRLIPENRMHQCPLPIIGLTGGIATGKSTVAKLFREQSALVIDADALVKRIYQQEKTLDFIKLKFPNAINNKLIDFKMLRTLAFSEVKSRELLENFIYARMPDLFKSEITTDAKFIIYDVPLLFEKKLAPLIDQTLVIYTPERIQRERLFKRDGSSIDIMDSILKSQWPIDKKKEHADFILNNTDSIDKLKILFKELCSELFCDY